MESCAFDMLYWSAVQYVEKYSLTAASCQLMRVNGFARSLLTIYGFHHVVHLRPDADIDIHICIVYAPIAGNGSTV